MTGQKTLRSFKILDQIVLIGETPLEIDRASNGISVSLSQVQVEFDPDRASRHGFEMIDDVII